MAREQVATVVRHICRMIGSHAVAGHGDGELLRRFVQAQEQAAFTALVQRHGPMVLGVCRRVLHSEHDAEDVFQATFLVLARKARALNQYGSLGNWLHTVAFRLALKTRGQSTQQRAQERQVADVPELSAHNSGWEELRSALDAELERLPIKYRAPIVLCYLEGKTNTEAARELGWPVGSVKIRLARARALLRDRLSRRGLTLSAGLLGPTLAEQASAAVPLALLETTSEAASLFATGNVTAAGVISLRGVPIAQGALRDMFISKFKTFVVFFVSLGFVGVGSGILLSRDSTLDPGAPSAPAAVAVAPKVGGDPAPAEAPNPALLEEQERTEERSLRRIQVINRLMNTGRFSEAYQEALVMQEDLISQGAVIPPAVLAVLKQRAAAESTPVNPKANKRALTGERIEAINQLMNTGRFGEAYHEALSLQADQIARGVVLSPAMFTVLKQLAPAPTPQQVNVQAKGRALSELLQDISRSSGIGIVIDSRVAAKAAGKITVSFPSIPAETAIRLLADMADLQPVRVDQVLYVTSKENARALLDQAPAKPRP
jgi:RNA polymerase sigma factor (sigma-70 family)